MNEGGYWNSSEVISDFSRLSPQSYWIDFFSGVAEPLCKRVLDLGCGGGRNTEMIARLGYQVWACDLHQGMVYATRDRMKSFLNPERIIQADMINLPYVDEYFDYVLANGILHNACSITELAEAIQQISRVLAVDGRLCLNAFTDAYIDPSLDEIGDHLYLTANGMRMTLLSPVELCEKFQENGLRPFGETYIYNRELDVGIRSVIRGVFVKLN